MLVVMKRFQHGFTIVEVLVVVSTLGILVAIGLVGWGQMVKWSQNNAREGELSSWVNSFKLYHSRFAYYPLSTTPGSFCLGDNFTGGRCGANTNFAQNAALMTELRKAGNIPQYDHPTITVSGTTYVGPYVTYSGTGQARLIGVFNRSDCPKDTVRETSSPAGLSYCSVTLNP